MVLCMCVYICICIHTPCYVTYYCYWPVGRATERLNEWHTPMIGFLGFWTVVFLDVRVYSMFGFWDLWICSSTTYLPKSQTTQQIKEEINHRKSNTKGPNIPTTKGLESVFWADGPAERHIPKVCVFGLRICFVFSFFFFLFFGWRGRGTFVVYWEGFSTIVFLFF